MLVVPAHHDDHSDCDGDTDFDDISQKSLFIKKSLVLSVALTFRRRQRRSSDQGTLWKQTK